MKKSDFYYELPDSLIAQKPLPERCASRLLCLDSRNGLIKDSQFSDFIELINKDDLLIFNDTRVIPARLFGRKETGGKVEILIERIIDKQQAVAHVRASKSPQPGARIKLDDGSICTVTGREDDLFRLDFTPACTVLQLLDRIGHMPLPPYINRDDDADDQTRYQTVFARNYGAVAAPTAGLHFDQAIMDKIRLKGVSMAFITLHVGSGTFQPVREEALSDHKMHSEYYTVSEAVVSEVNKTRSKGGRVIAIGTTAVRALESASIGGELQAGCGDTRLFITPGYSFKSVDAILTNFHLPESTLLMLVAAFAGYEHIMHTYRYAIDNSYRFFSYGDAMFII